jgi:hypothetical protein
VVRQELGHDLRPLLDRELSRLPDKYRLPIVLCDLEWKTRKEAARQLGCPEGTVAGRLARARAMLAKRLARHGPAVSVGALAAMLAQDMAAAGVPPSVVGSTIKAASLLAAGQAVAAGVISARVAALTEGVLQAMLFTRLKIATAVLLTGSIVWGVGVFMQRTLADKPAVQEKSKGQGEEDSTELTAVVQAVDAAKKTLTVVSKPLDTTTFDVAKDARVVLDDGTGGKLGFKDGKLSDLAEGFVVTVAGRAARGVDQGRAAAGVYPARGHPPEVLEQGPAARGPDSRRAGRPAGPRRQTAEVVPRRRAHRR